MSLADVEEAKRAAIKARERLDSRLMAVQRRLQPANLAGEAWEGVKDRSVEIAEGAMEAVKKRPGTVTLTLGAIAIFLTRDPLRRAITRLISHESDDQAGIDAAPPELVKRAGKARPKTRGSA